MFYIGLYTLSRENMKKSSSLKQQDIWYVALPSGPLGSLYNLCSWGRKLARPLHRLI